MKARTILLALLFCLAGPLACWASDSNLGSWKLNEAKSKIPAGAAKNTSVVYTAVGKQYKCVVEGVDAGGKSFHNEWTGNFDGKDYPVVGDPASDTRSLQMVDAHHYKLTQKKAGKVTVTGTVATSPDGKSRTVDIHLTDAAGKKGTVTYAYDKQ